MNTLQFISSLVNSLAWPAAAVGMAFILRKPFAKLLSSRSVKILKAGPQGFEVEFFDEKLAEARTELKEAGVLPVEPVVTAPAYGHGVTEAPEVLLPSELPASKARDDFTAEMQQLAEVSPRAVVPLSFGQLERVLRDAVERAEDGSTKPTRSLSSRALARKGFELGLLSASEVSAFEDIAVLRNLIAHGGTVELDRRRALAYADTVEALITSLDGWA